MQHKNQNNYLQKCFNTNLPLKWKQDILTGTRYFRFKKSNRKFSGLSGRARKITSNVQHKRP